MPTRKNAHSEPPAARLRIAFPQLFYVASPVFDPAVRERERALSANIVVEGVKALFSELQGRGVDFAQTLKEQPWGATDFVVRDLDGNLLCFASPVDDPRE